MPGRSNSLSQEQLQRMNIGRRYWGADFKRIPAEANYSAVVRRYVAKLPAMRTSGWGLLFWGANSVGKTYALSAVLKEAVRQRFTAYCVGATTLKTCFIENPAFDAEQTVPERIRTVDFLLIEDLGKEFRGKSGWAELQFENLLRIRTRELLPTLITTNLSPASLEDIYKLSSLELAMEMLYPFECKGPNFRHALSARMGAILDP